MTSPKTPGAALTAWLPGLTQNTTPIFFENSGLVIYRSKLEIHRTSIKDMRRLLYGFLSVSGHKKSRRILPLNALCGPHQNSVAFIVTDGFSSSFEQQTMAAITEPNAIQKTLDHVHQQQTPPRLPPSRVTTGIQFDVS